MNDLKQRCTEVFARVLELPVDQIHDDASPDTLDEWDSLAHVQLVFDLEKEFSIEIPPDEAIELETFTSVLDYVESKCHRGQVG